MQRIIPFENPLKNKDIAHGVAYAVLGISCFILGAWSMWLYMGRVPSVPPEQQKIPVQGVINANSNAQDLHGADFGIFWNVWATIQQRYVGREKLDYQKMVYGAVQGMVDSLGDPYSVFFPPEQNKEFQDEVSGQFDGIGIEIGIKNSELTVIAPLEGTPAKSAGLMSGDVIVKVNGSSTQSMSLDEAIKHIRGPKGTSVTLNIFRSGWDAPKDFSITRDTISVPSAKLDLVGKDVAVIHLYNFFAPADLEFKKVALQAMMAGRSRIIIDLRGNPGGYFDTAVDIAGWFVPNGTVVVKEDDGTGAYVCDMCTARGLNLLGSDKVVVLIDGGSASASEILSGALRDIKGVKLIGEQSFGKGSVQDVYPIDASASLKLTIAKWLTPNGYNIGSVGLKPDIEVKASATSTDDLQLQKALEVVRSL